VYAFQTALFYCSEIMKTQCYWFWSPHQTT